MRSKGHELASKKRIRTQDLRGQPFVSLCHGDGTRAKIDKVFEAAGVERVLAIETQFGATCCEMVAVGLGITLVHPWVAQEYLHREVVVLPFEPHILMPIYVIWPTEHARTRLADEFIRTLQEYCQALADASMN